ncbi:MAG TPA: N-6 DNA methylase, partial [Thermodesulfobacteriota bacterium]|nr:N-6 DNA methylase [Thermodesulfobacteriota bacterium]
MADVPQKRSQSQFRAVLDQLQQELPTHDVVVVLAALIYLRWADFQEAEQEAIAAFDDTDYKPVVPSSLHWRSWHMLPPYELQALFSARLPEILERLNNSRHVSLATHLHRIASAVRRLGRLSPHALDFFIHWLADQPFETPRDRRELLAYFDAVLDKSRDKYAAAYRTPALIVQLLVSLAAPSVGDRVYDPCFGSAGLLTAAFDYARSKATQQFSRGGTPALSVSGVEINLETYIIGLVRLTLAGIDDPQIELGNSLERTPSNNPERDGFDIVIANPPWGWRANSPKEDRWGLQHYSFPTNEGSGFFVQHALQQLRPNGRAVMLVPDGLLFRSGSDQQLRRYLVENHTVESIVSLPIKAFMPYSSVKASILMLRRGGTTKRIRMIDATSVLEKCKGENSAILHYEMLDELTESLRRTTQGDDSWDIDIETLPEIDWDLTPKRRNRSGLGRILDDLRTEVTFVCLKECCEISSGRSFPRDQLISAPPFREKAAQQKSLFSDAGRLQQKSLFDVPVIPYVRIKDVQRGQASGGSYWLSPNVASSVDARWKLKAGDILLSKAGTIGKTGLVRNGAVGAIAAAGLFVLRPYQDRLDPHFLLAYLSSRDIKAWLDDRTRGATVRHLSISSLGELPVAVPPLQVQQRVALEHREYGVDALTFLAQLLTQSEQDTTAAWIEEAGTAFLSENEAVEDPLNLVPLDRLATYVREEPSRAMHGNHGAEDLEPWILAFHEAISGLNEVGRIPLGPGLLSVLQESAKGLDRAMGLITRSLPYHAMARDFVKRIADHIGRACSTLLDTVKLVFSAETV